MFMSTNTANFAMRLVSQSYEDRKAGKDVPDIASVMLDYYMNGKDSFGAQELGEIIDFISEIKDHPSCPKWQRTIADVISTQYTDATDAPSAARREIINVAVEFTRKMGKLRSQILDILIDDMIRYFTTNGTPITRYSRPSLYSVYCLKSADKGQLKKIKMVIMRNNYGVTDFVEAVNMAKSQTYTEADFYSDLPDDWGLGVII